MVANGATHWAYDVSPSFPATVYWNNIITKKDYDAFNNNDCYYSFNDVIKVKNPPVCDATWARINELAENLNWYDLYRPVYDGGLGSGHDALEAEQARLGSAMVEGELKTYKKGMTMSEYTPWAHSFLHENKQRLGDYTTDYMNTEEMRKALHIPKDV